MTTHSGLFKGEGFAPFGNENPIRTVSDTLAAYADIGEEILLADLTRPEIGLPVCRAFFRDPRLQPVFPTGYDLSPL